MYFLHIHLNNVLENCGDVNEKQGERFHRDFKLLEERYQGRWENDGRLLLGTQKPYSHHLERSRKSFNLHVILNIWSIKSLFNFRLKTPFFPNRTLLDVNTAFLLKTQMFLVRGAAKILVGKSLFRRGKKIIFGLASGKASKCGYEGASRFQPLRKRLNVVLSIFLITFREP